MEKRPGRLSGLVLVLVCAVPLSAPAADFKPRVADELLRRLEQFELPGTVFEIPAEVYREFIRLRRLGPPRPRPPVPSIITRQEHRLSPGATSAELDVTIEFTVFAPELLAGVPLLPASVAFGDIQLDGRAQKLAVVDGWLTWRPPAAGRHVLTAQARLKPRHVGRSFSVSYPCRRAVLTRVQVAADRAWEVSAAGGGKVVGQAGATRGTLVVRPSDRLTVSWCEPLEAAEHDPVISTTCLAACDFAGGTVSVTATLDVLVTRGKTDHLVLELPAGADRVSVTGSDVRRVEGRGGERTIRLRGPLLGRTRLSVGFEVPRARTSGKIGLEYFGIRGATSRGGHLIVSNSGGGELLEDENRLLVPEAFFGLPDRLMALSREKPTLAYSMKRGRWRLACDVVLASEVPMPPTLIDVAEHVVVRRADGNLMARASFEVRNSNRQFLRVTLPAGARFMVALVDRKSVAITQLADGRYSLPLKKSIATLGGLVSFPVEIIYLRRGTALGRRGEFVLELPRVDAPIAYATCKLYAPGPVRFRDWRGPLRQVDLLTTERAHEEMMVGRAHRERRSGDRLGERPPVVLDPARDPEVNLAGNYYRSALEAYNRREYEQAATSLKKVLEIAPKSTEASNAEKLLRNTKLILGIADGKGNLGRLGRVKAQQIVTTGRSGDEKLITEQRQLLSKGQTLARQGQTDAAAEALAGAVILGKELQKRGQTGKDQAAVLRRSQEELNKQVQQQKRLLDIEKQIAKTQTELRQVRLAPQQQPAPDTKRPDIFSENDGDSGEDIFGADEDGDRTDLQERTVAFASEVRKKERIVTALERLAEPTVTATPDKPAETGAGVAGKRLLLQRARSQLNQPAGGPLSPTNGRTDLANKERELRETKKKLDEAKKLAEPERDWPDREPAFLVMPRGRGRAGPQVARGSRGGETILDGAEHGLIGGRRGPSGGQGGQGSAQETGRPSSSATQSARPAGGYRWRTPRRTAIPFTRTGPMYPDDWDEKKKRTAGVALDESHEDTRKGEITGPEQDAKWKRDLISRLEEPVSFDFAATPLDDVVAVLRSLKKVSIVVDKQAVEELGVTDVSMSADRVTVGEAFNRILRPRGLGWTVRDGAIYITSRRRLAERQKAPTIYYDKTAWKPLESVMNRCVSFDFRDTPVDDVLNFFRNKLNVKIAVEKVPYRKVWSVTLTARDVEFKEALAWICSQLDLAYTVRDGAVVISEPGDHLLPRTKTVTRFYDVTDLSIQQGGQVTTQALIALIKDNTRLNTWAADGTANDELALEGNIKYRNGKLIVTHNPQVQDEIKALFDNARKNLGQKVNVSSYNAFVPESLAKNAGVSWVSGNNHVNYAVVDEGQVRALLELSQRLNRKQSSDDNRLSNNAVVGTQTTIANHENIDIEIAGDAGNRFNYQANPVFVPHDKFLLVSNGGYLTVVGATERYHLTERITPRRIVAEVPPRIDLPLVGQVIRFEKTLLQPEDVPVLRARYRMDAREGD